MVQIAGREQALAALRSSVGRFGCLGLGALVVVAVLYSSCTARVLPNEWGVEQKRLRKRVRKSPGPLHPPGPRTQATNDLTANYQNNRNA